MTHRLRAIYERGLLCPLEPPTLAERSVVEVVISDNDLKAPPVQFVPAAAYSRWPDDSVTLEEVRRSLAKIPGSLAEDLIAERNERL